MRNCLKTQLKSSVQNDALIKMGHLVININETEGSIENSMLFLNTQETVFTVKGNGHIGFSPSDITHTELTVSQNTPFYIYFENTNFSIDVSSKYTFTRMESGSNYKKNNFGCNVDDLAYTNTTLTVGGTMWTGNLASIAHVQQLSLLGTNVHGDIEVLRGKAITVPTASAGTCYLSENTNLYGDISALNSINCPTLRVNNTSISGRLESFLNTNITSLYIDATNISGSIEDFAAAQAQVRESGTLMISALYCSQITYNGKPVDRTLTITFTGGGNYTIS